MLAERSYLPVKDGMAGGFAAMMAKSRSRRWRAWTVSPSSAWAPYAANSGKFMLFIDRGDMDARTAFTKLPVFNAVYAMPSPFTRGGEMEHFGSR